MAADEKDRLGNKLRDVERGREDQFFAEQDRQLIEKLRREKEGAAEEKLRQAAHNRCPKCGTPLTNRKLHGVTVDACSACRGMWIDEGELQEIARREDEGWVSRWLRQEFRETE